MCGVVRVLTPIFGEYNDTQLSCMFEFFFLDCAVEIDVGLQQLISTSIESVLT